MENYSYYSCIIGTLRVACEDGAITSVEPVSAPAESLPNDLTRLAVKQLGEYFAGERRAFELPLRYGGTPFQMSVLRELLRIPYGETKSYGDIARAVASPKSCRAVGGACHRNPLLILIPCHRVIGSHGELTGFGGGLDMKKQLLTLERNGASRCPSSSAPRITSDP